MMARAELLLQSGGFSLGQLSNCLEGRRGLVLEIVKDVGHIPLEVVQGTAMSPPAAATESASSSTTSMYTMA